ncbi:hypothetical protein I317_02988 [Kwoniella heveanensis CBS 569]|nr:hypothetical protein I317_02988 [Kwoniella heveanensis CBS 569]
MPPRGHKRPHRQPYGLNYQHQGYTPRDGYADDQAGSRDPSQYQSSFSHTAQPQTYPHASYPGANSSSSSNFTIARGWTVQIPPQAYIQAYEAQLVYPSSSSQPDGPRYGSATRQAEGTAGHGTIRYAGEVKTEGESGGTSGGYGWNTEGEGSGSGQAQEEVWADRHDIIHLLPSLTIRNRYNQRPPASPTGSTRSLSSSSSWDSLPSDVEEKFALSDPEEIEAYEIAKKKKWMETLRAERLKEREKEDRALGVSANGWKDDEEASYLFTFCDGICRFDRRLHANAPLG